MTYDKTHAQCYKRKFFYQIIHIKRKNCPVLRKEGAVKVNFMFAFS